MGCADSEAFALHAPTRTDQEVTQADALDCLNLSHGSEAFDWSLRAVLEGKLYLISTPFIRSQVVSQRLLTLNHSSTFRLVVG